MRVGRGDAATFFVRVGYPRTGGMARAAGSHTSYGSVGRFIVR